MGRRNILICNRTQPHDADLDTARLVTTLSPAQPLFSNGGRHDLPSASAAGLRKGNEAEQRNSRLPCTVKEREREYLPSLVFAPDQGNEMGTNWGSFTITATVLESLLTVESRIVLLILKLEVTPAPK